MEHALEEASEGLRRLADHVLDLCHQLLLAATLEHHDFDRVRLVFDVAFVVSVLHHQLVLLEVRTVLQLQVLVVSHKTLAQGTTDGLWVTIVNTECHHF